MVKTQNLVPEIYYKESRDFQYFGRLFDIIFNYSKTNTDLLKKIEYKAQSNLIDLLLQTLGFQPDYNSKIDSLYQLSLIWSDMMRNKGNIESIKQLLTSLLNFEKSDSTLSVIYVKRSATQPYNRLDIDLSSEITDDEIYLIEKVLDYVLPVTVIYQIRKVKVSTQGNGYLTQNEYAEARAIKPTYTLANGDNMDERRLNKSDGVMLGDTTPIEQGDIRFTRVTSDSDK